MSALPLWMARPSSGGPVHRDSWFRMRNQTTDAPAEVWIYDAIGQWGITANDFAEQFGSLQGDAVTVRINSPGGSVFDGKAIYQCIREHPAKVTVMVDSLAASAASFIAMAGDEVVTSPISTWMVHSAETYSGGNAKMLRKDAEVLDLETNTISRIYAERTGQPAAYWLEVMDSEAWFNAEGAVTAGLADRISDPRPRRSNEPAAHAWDIATILQNRPQAPAPSEAVMVEIDRLAAANAVEPESGDFEVEATDREWEPDQEWWDALRAGLTVR